MNELFNELAASHAKKMVLAEEKILESLLPSDLLKNQKELAEKLKIVFHQDGGKEFFLNEKSLVIIYPSCPSEIGKKGDNYELTGILNFKVMREVAE